MTLRHNYRETTISRLGGFQIIETFLKIYITSYYNVTRRLVGDRLVFEFSGKEYENAALGKLITIFSKMTSNIRLVKAMRELVKHRDYVAHQALVYLYDEATPDQHYREMAEKNMEVLDTIVKIERDLTQEIRRIHEVLESPPAGT